ncbi:MAG: acyltransferase [Bacteroidales bacterium]|nr:acyltransferase [Bacteroidales bacterium]
MNLMRWFKEKLSSRLSVYVKPLILPLKYLNNKKLENVRISNTTFIDSKEKLILGNNVFIGHFNYIEASSGIVIEEGCQITNFITITTHSSHISIRLYGSEYCNHSNLIGYVVGPVHIGKYTFVGPHSVIMPNTKIGKGCVVSAFSYVKGDFPDFSIISGNPAQVVGDTRKIDEPYLKQYPELQSLYNTWIKD